MNRSMFDASHAIAVSRRRFLGSLAAAGAAPTVFGAAPPQGGAVSTAKKVVVVTFGGGARDDETFMPDGHENIPHLLHELLPQATFFSQVVNRGILGHYVANASIVTGAYEDFNNFAAVQPENPTAFEYLRKGLKRPATDCWVVAPSNGFTLIGESTHRSFGEGFGAGVVLPKRLLASARSEGAGISHYEDLLHRGAESPLYAPMLANRNATLRQTAEALKLSFDDFAQRGQSRDSADELSVYITRNLMRQLSPSLLWVTLHDIDIAHSGAFSLYVDGIKRCDRLCAELWNAIQHDPEYANKTTMFILPDFGRDSDVDVGGNGFQHHRTGSAASRTTWMLAMGPTVRENRVVDRPIESVDLVPTIGALFGFDARQSQGTPIQEALSR